MLTFPLGPILALLPQRWRNSLPARSTVEWRLATVLSGLAESLFALINLICWYSYSVTHWAEEAVYAAIRAGAQINPNAIGFAALAIWAMHPLTWVIALVGVEGTVRMVAAAFTETNFGIFPLYIVERIFSKISGRGEPGIAKAAGFSQSNMASIAGTIRDKTLHGSLPELPDELFFTSSGTDELLEIRASQQKQEWTPPRTVRIQDAFYRLEGSSIGLPPRPFRYTLRKLSAGVMGRTVLVYAPKQEPVLAKK